MSENTPKSCSTDEVTVHLIYPEDRFVSGATVIGWWIDRLMDERVASLGDGDEPTTAQDDAELDHHQARLWRETTLAEAIAGLEDIGACTFRR